MNLALRSDNFICLRFILAGSPLPTISCRPFSGVRNLVHDLKNYVYRSLQT